MYFIFWYDYVMLPLYLLVIIAFLYLYFRRKHGYNPVLKKHFNRALALKFVGCIAIGLIYEHYYQGAYDGRFYYECAKLLTDYWAKNPDQIVPVLFQNVREFNETNVLGLDLGNVSVYADESFTVGKFTAFFNFLSFNAFLPCSLFFCTFSFISIWNLFIFFQKELQLNAKVAGLCSIYIPSILIWSSSIFKDTITFAALIWIFISGYYLFVKPRRLLTNLSAFVFFGFLMAQVKVYILAAFVPVFIIYVFNSYRGAIHNRTLRKLLTPFLLSIGVVGVALFLQNADALLGRYSVNQVLETASQTAMYIADLQAGSAYTMNVDFSSPLGILAAIPAGINVTLFRPYPWEFLKPFTLLASIESMIFLYFTIAVFRRVGIGKAIRLIAATPVLQLCLFFTLIFAFMVGISASNFGTLVRYKIPCLPFYALLLALLDQHAKKKSPNKPASAQGKAMMQQNSHQVVSIRS